MTLSVISLDITVFGKYAQKTEGIRKIPVLQLKRRQPSRVCATIRAVRQAMICRAASTALRGVVVIVGKSA